MFKHHKYCVIEVSGLLVASTGSDGRRSLYLLDNARGALPCAEDDVAQSGDLPMADKRDGIRITDAVFIEFINRMSSRSESKFNCSWPAQVAGTLDLDGGAAQFSCVSQAFVHTKEKLIKYEPR